MKRLIKWIISFAPQTAMPKSVTISKNCLSPSSNSEKILRMETSSSPRKTFATLVSSALAYLT